MGMNIGSTPPAADDAEPIMDINTTPLSHSLSPRGRGLGRGGGIAQCPLQAHDPLSLTLSHEGRGKEMERMAWA
jgi:hypothetical protein